MRYENNYPFMGLQTDLLKEVIREVVRDEFKLIENKLTPPSKQLTRLKAAKIAQVSPKTISRWVDKGYVTNLGKGRKILVEESDLLNFNNHKN
jgi:hypothetical protein